MVLGGGVGTVVEDADDEIDVGVGAVRGQCACHPGILATLGVAGVCGDFVADVVGVQGQDGDVAVHKRIHRGASAGAVAGEVHPRKVAAVAVGGIGGFHV